MSDNGDNENGDRRGALVAEYVLGLLGPAEHARVGRLIEADPVLQRERDFWAARFASLDKDFAEVPPPAHVLERVEARLFGVQAKTSFW